MQPDPYTGAFWTLRYDECVSRIGALNFGFGPAYTAVSANTTLTGCTHFVSKWPELVTLLEMRYKYRELSAETPDEWMEFCETRIVEAAMKWENILAMESSLDLDDPNADKVTTTYGSKVTVREQETPYGQLDADSNYLSGQVQTERSGTDTTETKNDLDANILMDLRRRWEDTRELIVRYFSDLFISQMGGDFVL